MITRVNRFTRFFFRSAYHFFPILTIFLATAPLHAFDARKPFDFSSDVLEYDDATQILTGEGNVVVVQGTSTLHADLIHYDRLNKRLDAQGHVVLRDKGTLLLGDVMTYDLVQENATVEGGKGFGSPWYFQGESWEKKLDFLIGKQTSFTSCDLIDPHYHIRSSRVHLIPDQFFWAWNNVFYEDEIPAFYSPFLYKSFGPRRIVFQVQPGQDSVKGSFARTTTTIRLIPGMYDKVLIDHYTTAGTGFGNEFDYERDTYKGSLFGYYIDPQGTPELVGAPKTGQYNVRFYHWQKVAAGLTFQSNINHRKNVSFNNQFFTQDSNQSVNDVNNSAALTYQNDIATQRLIVESFESPDGNSDPLFGNTHIQSASLPRYEVTFYQKPIWSPQISTNTLDQVLHPHHIGALQLSGASAVQNYYSREDEQTRLKASAAGTLSLPINLSRNWSLSSSLTPSLRWQDKYDPFVRPSSGTTVVIPVGIFRGYQGRMSGSSNLRYRPISAMTIDQSYSYTVRMTPNSLKLDRALQDGGIETSHVSGLIYLRPSRLLLIRSYSGYDLRKLSDETQLDFRQRRVDPWTNEWTIYQPNSTTSYYFRHQLGYYPTRSLYWGGHVRWALPYRTQLETGISYNAGDRGFLTWNSKAGFYFSPSWRVDAIFNTKIPNTTFHSISDGNIIQSEFVVTRRMHCWDIQFIYKNLPPFTREYSFLFNLRLGAQALKEMTNQDLEAQFYPWRATDR